MPVPRVRLSAAKAAFVDLGILEVQPDDSGGCGLVDGRRRGELRIRSALVPRAMGSSLCIKPMSPNVFHLQVDLQAPLGAFFRRLQRQLDITKVLQVGCDIVTEEQVAAQREFGRFVPANGAQLTHQIAQAEAQDWLLSGFLRDAIESTGLFLDECLSACAAMSLGASGNARAEDLHRLLHELPAKHHQLHLPQKLRKLESEWGVATRLNGHVLSLNRARACVVHRLGVVGKKDVDGTGVLAVILQHLKFMARGQETGTERILVPGLVLPEESMLAMQFADSHRCFSIGDRVRLQPGELYDVIVTLWRFGLGIGEALEAYGRSLGIERQPPRSKCITRGKSRR